MINLHPAIQPIDILRSTAQNLIVAALSNGWSAGDLTNATFQNLEQIECAGFDGVQFLRICSEEFRAQAVECGGANVAALHNAANIVRDTYRIAVKKQD